MAFNTLLSGDRFGSRASSNVPKAFDLVRYSAVANNAGLPAPLQGVPPAVGHLVALDSGLNDGVMRAGGTNTLVPYGLIESVNSSNGTLSIWKLPKTFSLLFEYPVGSPPTRLQQIQANGTAGSVVRIGGFFRDQVKGVAAPTGIGTVVAVDEPVGTCVVEFGS